MLAIVAVVGWNLIYTTTAYNPPKEKRLDIFFVTNAVSEETLEWVRTGILERYPEVEEANASSIVYTDDDNYYGSMQLTTYLGAGEGDLIILPRERFMAFGQSDTFVRLDDAIESGALDLQGIDVTKGILTPEEGERGVYGIPAASLYGMMDHGIDNRDLYIAVLAYSPNTERATDWIGWLIDETLAEKPDWLIEYEEKTGAGTSEVSDLPSF